MFDIILQRKFVYAYISEKKISSEQVKANVAKKVWDNYYYFVQLAKKNSLEKKIKLAKKIKKL